MGPIKKRRGANLPHWTANQATYFVTFRLADSLPQEVLAQYRAERERLSMIIRDKNATPEAIAREHDLFAEKIEKYLNSGAGACWMNMPPVADTVQKALLFFHGKRYWLDAWAVMPNHVHVVVEPCDEFELPAILHS